MLHLEIKDIFSKFNYYHTHYMSIIQNPNLYYQPVKGAYIQLPRFNRNQIYLGELLQLWFGDKWTEHQVKLLNQTHHHGLISQELTECWHNSLFIFAIDKSTIFATTFAFAWSTEEKQIKRMTLEQMIPYYCHYLTLERPKQYA